jgi:hypothetical protein
MDRPVADVHGRIFLFRFFVACMLGFPSKLLATHAHNPKKTPIHPNLDTRASAITSSNVHARHKNEVNYVY